MKQTTDNLTRDDIEKALEGFVFSQTTRNSIADTLLDYRRPAPPVPNPGRVVRPITAAEIAEVSGEGGMIPVTVAGQTVGWMRQDAARQVCGGEPTSMTLAAMAVGQ